MIELYQKASDPEFWKRVREDPAYGDLIDELKAKYAAERRDTITVIPYGKRFVYYESGDRVAMESIYFQLRNWLAHAAALALLYPEETHYLSETEDLIFACCDEYSWALPAHTSGTLADDPTRIDLFAAQTGMLLAEVCIALGERLAPIIRQRAESEVRRRIIESYMHNTYFWETAKNNWAAVCICGISTVFLWLEPKLYQKHLPKFLSVTDCFLAGYPEDGTCLEGHSYWLYGFGHFVWFADLLCQQTNGAHDILHTEKVKQIAAYLQRNFLLGNTTVSFSDGERHGKAELGLQHYLHRQFPDAVSILPRRVCYINGSNVGFYGTLRSFVYYDPTCSAQTQPKRDYFLRDASQLILNREKYSFAIKGGTNGEPHNHNDIGSIILSDKTGQLLCDLGAGRYTRDYFKAGRYDILCNSSLGHSVPIIDGKPQPAGAQYHGTLDFENGVATVEMAAAYDCEKLRSLRRTVIPQADGITLCDSFEGVDLTLTKRFVTTLKPTLSADSVQIGSAAMYFSPQDCTPEISTQIHDLHYNRINNPNGGKEEIFCIDFVLKPGVRTARFEIKLTD